MRNWSKPHIKKITFHSLRICYFTTLSSVIGSLILHLSNRLSFFLCLFFILLVADQAKSPPDKVRQGLDAMGNLPYNQVKRKVKTSLSSEELETIKDLLREGRLH